MAATETYALAGDFGSQVDIKQLEEEIKADAAIPTAVQGVSVNANTDTVQITFASTLDTAEKTALDALVAAYVFSPMVPQASASMPGVVAADGSGHFTTVAAAFNAGFRQVVVKAGEYKETETVVIPPFGSLEGLAPEITVLDFSTAPAGLAAAITVDGSAGAPVYATGTLDATHNSATLTGTGTAFVTSGVQPGWSVVLGDDYHEILSVDSDTSLTLTDVYRGPSVSGKPTKILLMLTRHCLLKNFSVNNAPNTAVHINSARHVMLERVHVRSNGGGADALCVVNSGHVSFLGCDVVGAANHGMVVDGSLHTSIYHTNLQNAGGHGMAVQGMACCTLLQHVRASGNGSSGVLVTGGSMHTSVSKLSAKHNTLHGLHVDGNARHSTVTRSVLSANHTAGAHLAGPQSSLSHSTVAENVSVGIECAADQQQVHHNSIRGNGGDNVRVASSENHVEGNHILDGSASGVFVQANALRNMIQGNTIKGNAAYGLSLHADADDAIVTGNQFESNATANVDVNSLSAVISNNKLL